jgi:hypothetical protein
MQNFHLPHVHLPEEFVTLLKASLPITTGSGPIFEVIRPNRALLLILENAFSEFNDGRGIEKVMIALGWSNFRERMASIYVYKAIFGNYPTTTNMELVADVRYLESLYAHHGIHSYSRLFLLGFYLKLANLSTQKKADNQFLEIKIPYEVGPLLKLAQGRSQRIDWLILIVTHLYHAFGEKMLANNLVSGKNFEDMYELMTPESREQMFRNLLAYGASIKESEVFLYEKI